MTKYRVSIYFHPRPHEDGRSVAFIIEAEDERVLRDWMTLTLPREVNWYNVDEITEAA